MSFRLVFTDGRAIGPGKIALLERIAATGSISAAGREMRMSYRRAWELIDDLNATFRQPLVHAQPGGVGGGGAQLTDLGRRVVGDYRAMEASVHEGCRRRLSSLDGLVARRRVPRRRPDERP